MLEQEEILIPVAQAFLQRRLRAVAPGAIVTLYWDEFYRLYASVIVRMVRGSLAGPEADDLVQEIWRIIAERLPDFQWNENRGGFRAWLGRLIHDKTVDLIRRRDRRSAEPLHDVPEAKTPLAAEGDPAAALERSWRLEVARTVLEELRPTIDPVNLRIVKLHYWEDQRVPQIAETMGMTRSQVESRLHRVVKKLRTRLAAYLGEE